MNMIRKIILYGVLILSWSSLFKLDKDAFKRYLPVGTFISLIYTLLSKINESQKWWKVTQTIFPRLPSNFPFAYGPFLFLPIWVFKFTFGKFWLYSITNATLGYLFAYPITNYFEKFGVYKMRRMSRNQLFLLSFSSSIVIYLYQVFINGTLKGSLGEQ